MELKEFPVEAQKLIYKGKNQKDGGKTLGDLGYKEGEFMVVMVSKVKTTRKCLSCLEIQKGCC